MIDISPGEFEQTAQVPQMYVLNISNPTTITTTTKQNKRTTLLFVLAETIIMIAITAIAMSTDLSEKLNDPSSISYRDNDFFNQICDPNGYYSQPRRELQGGQGRQQQQNQQQPRQNQGPSQYQPNQQRPRTFNQTTSQQYYQQYNSTSSNEENYYNCIGDAQTVYPYGYITINFNNLEPLFYISIVASIIAYIGFETLKWPVAKVLTALIFLVFQSFVIATFALIYKVFNNTLQPFFACFILIEISYFVILIMALFNISRKNQLRTIFIGTPLLLLCEGALTFEIESIVLALLYSTFMICYEPEENENSVTSSIRITGFIYYLGLNMLMKIFVNPIRNLIDFPKKQSIQIQNTEDHYRLKHLRDAYLNIFGLLFFGYLIWILTYNTQFINIFAHHNRYSYFVFSPKGPLMMACYVVPGICHIISMLMYQNLTLNRITYSITYAIILLEYIFIALLVGAITTIEVTQNLFTLDTRGVQYFLILSKLGILALIGSTILNSSVEQHKQTNQFIAILFSSLSMLVYYYNYLSILIGVLASALFCGYVQSYSEYLISKDNHVFKIMIDDHFVTTSFLVNPVQIICHLIQWFINVRIRNKVTYSQPDQRSQNEKIEVEPKEE